MSLLLDVNGVPYRLLAGWVAMLRATVVWAVLCVPIITAPVATIVLLRTAQRLRSGDAPPSLAETGAILRGEFWPSLRLAALVGLGSGLVLSALLGPSPGGVWDTALPIVVVPIAVTWLLASQWAFAVAEERVDGAWAALRYSYLRAIRRPDLAAACTLGSAALLATGVLLPSSVWLPYWLTMPGLWAVLVTMTCRRAAITARAG